MAIPKRVPLIEHLPLCSPMSVHIFPSYYCNFKCTYCVHAMSTSEQKEMDFIKQTMPYDVYTKAIDEITTMSVKPKSIIFAGHGEPLMHRHIAEMVQYAKAHKAGNRVEIVTNGSLLTQKLSKGLIEAGLDRMRVSLQGCDGDTYERICGVKTDFNEFVDNLRYFYTHKTQTDFYIKIIDIALNSPDEATLFHNLFDEISDTAVVEHLFPNIQKIDHSTMGSELTQTKNNDTEARSVKICPMPFYMAVVLPNGDVTGCCYVEPPVIFGNITKTSLTEIWNSTTRLEFLRMQIKNRRANKRCKYCTSPDYGTQSADFLDEFSNWLTSIY